MKTILAAVMVMVAGVAYGQDCAVCSAGTTPARYQATFNSGKVAVLIRKKTVSDPAKETSCTWESPNPSLVFHHVGAGSNPAGGLFAVPQAIFSIVSIDSANNVGGKINTPNIRDGNGPFVITIYDRYGNALDMVTLVPF